MEKISKYLTFSNSLVSNGSVGEFSIKGKNVYVKDPVPQNVDIRGCLEFLLEKIPSFFCSNIDKFVIGDLEYLQSRKIDGVFSKKTVYITNEQESDDSLIADLIHEISHAFEEEYKEEIYGDSLIHHEFLQRRKSLLKTLKSENLIPDGISEEDFFSVDYSEGFDRMLYRNVGYDRLRAITSHIFISPYAATSLREYFANAFENFFVNDIFTVKKYCPSIYTKLINFLEF